MKRAFLIAALAVSLVVSIAATGKARAAEAAAAPKK